MVSRKEQELKALIPQVDTSEDYQNLISLVYKQGQYWLYHSKSINDDSFKNHADRVWKIVKYEAYKQKKMNTLRVYEGETIKFGRVRFKIKKLVVDKADQGQSIANESKIEHIVQIKNNINPNDSSVTNNQLRGVQMTTLENDHGPDNSNRMQTDPETRMTMNFARSETLGFDNRPFDEQQVEEGFLRNKEQEIKLKSAMLQRQNTNRVAMSDQQICRICLSEEEDNNLLISPCCCTGSMKHIHVTCL